MENLIFEKEFERCETDDNTSIIHISIDEYKFDVFISDIEASKTYKKYGLLGDDQYNTIDVIIALNKITRLLESTLDVVIVKE
ncbi:hypothetical protein [Clostridium paraputrificum]|uniref:hypothetical protein n=1 Tax=Clostridium paraputrificum TaxID=29363 RepID=UPI000C07CC42|nr:hypothetical protein [Clostridium paraputrificum]